MEDVIVLDVGGQRFRTTRSTLRCGGGFLAALVKGDLPMRLTEDGAVFIDRDPKHFGTILNYCRSGLLPEAAAPGHRAELEELRAEALFYDLPSLACACTSLGIAWCKGLVSPDRTLAWTSHVSRYQYHSSFHAVVSVPDVFNYRFSVYPADVELRRHQWQQQLASRLGRDQALLPAELYPAAMWKRYGGNFSSWIQSPLYVGLAEEGFGREPSGGARGKKRPASRQLRVDHPPLFPTYGYRDLEAPAGRLRLYAEEPLDATPGLEASEVQSTSLEDMIPSSGAVVHAWPLRRTTYVHLLPEGFSADALFHTCDDNELVQDVELRIDPGTPDERRVFWWGLPPPWAHSCVSRPKPRASNHVVTLAAHPETSRLHYFLQGEHEDRASVLSAVMELVVQRQGAEMRISALGPDFCQLWTYVVPCGNSSSPPMVSFDAFDPMTEIPLRITHGGSRCPAL
jgi:hypothetical protein